MPDILVTYLVMINAFGLSLMGLDKRRSINNQWRIPEKTLFLTSIIGGSLGTWAGMYLFRHKTKHWYFVAGMPAILIIQCVVLYFVKQNFF